MHDYVEFGKLLKLALEDQYVQLRAEMLSVDTVIRTSFTSNLINMGAEGLVNFIYEGHEALIA
jgi:hypothetical protein